MSVQRPLLRAPASRIRSTRTSAAFGSYCVYVNCAVEPFTDPRVRRAMHLVLNRPALIKVFESQEQLNLTRWVPPSNQFATPAEEVATLPGYRAEKEEDIAEAQSLLEEAGFADGLAEVDFLCASVPGHSQLLGPAIQDQLLRNLNVQTTIRTQERSLLSEEMRNGNFTLVLSTCLLYTSDAADDLTRVDLGGRRIIKKKKKKKKIK